MSRYTKTMREALVEMSEAFSKKQIKMAIGIASDPRYKQGNYSGAVRQIEKIKKGLADHPQVAAVLKRQNEEVELDEKYDLYHKSFSDAMQHAYDYAKKKLGITVDPKEIDSKVATGPKKPSEGKTNTYRLKGKGGNLQIQVYNKGGSKPFELNMYKEEVELDESVKASTNYDFDRLIKSGGLDKRDFQKAKNLYSSGKLMDLRKHIYNLDTEPTEAIMDVIAKNDPKAFMKMYPKSKKGEYMSSIAYNHGEENELDEAKVVVDLENDDPKLIKDIKKFGLKVKDLGSSGNAGYNEYEISGPQSKIDAANKKLNLMAEGKMKAVAMKIDSIVAKMKKNKEMKSFADKFKKEASKTLDIAKSLEKVLPDYIAGKDIAALVKEETIVESWELDEMKMDDPKLLKIFDKLKKGSTVKIKIDSSISKGKDYREFTVTAKNIVGKGKKFEQEKITLKAKDNPTGVKHFLYNRDGKVTLAIGDMGASIADIKENRMSAYTAAITKGVK